MHPTEKYLDGETIRKERIAAGFTIEEFARAVGTHCRSVIRWETGEVKPRAKHLRAVAKVLSQPPTPETAEFPETDVLSIQMLKVLVKAKVKHVRARDLPYLQRVFDQCQQDDEVVFTPELAVILLRASSYSTSP